MTAYMVCLVAHPTNRKWVITPVIDMGFCRVNPLTIGVITHLLSGMNHQVAAREYEHLHGSGSVIRPCKDFFFR